MKTMAGARSPWIRAACAVACSANLIAGEVRETHPRRATAGVPAQEHRLRQQVLQELLLAELPAGVLDRPLRVEVSAQEMDEVDRRSREDPGPTVVGLAKAVGVRVDLAILVGGPGARGPGVLRPTPEGGFVWAVALTSAGASALRVGLAELRLPEAAELFVHNARGQAFGPYSGRAPGASGTLWSHTVMGETLVVQLRHRGRADPANLRSAGFVIESLGRIGPRFLPAAATAQEAFCSYNASCIENAECFGPGTWSFLDEAQDGVGLMLWVSGAFLYTCTGGLLADTDDASEIPYFLTANHCLSKANAAAGLETYFQFRVPCGGGCPAEWAGGGIQVLGATVKATNRTGDYTLLQLQQTPPAGSVYLGWTTAPVANADGTELFRVSHPATAPQAFSKQAVDTAAPTCITAPRGNWIYSRHQIGAIEGGSSGAPVCNAAGQVVGQLTGACGLNTGDPCDAVNHAIVDGALASYFEDVAAFLDPPVTCTPSTEICDGLDNDCDGQIDEGFAAPAGAVALTAVVDLLSWTAAPDATGYDVVRGDLATLASTGGDFTAATAACLADDLGATSLADPELPPAGAILWTLVRPTNCIGAGTFGSLERDQEIEASSSSCP
jgi:hypothetical protein